MPLAAAAEGGGGASRLQLSLRLLGAAPPVGKNTLSPCLRCSRLAFAVE